MKPIFGSKLVLFMHSSHNLRIDKIPSVQGATWSCCVETQPEIKANMEALPCVASKVESLKLCRTLLLFPKKEHLKSSPA